MPSGAPRHSRRRACQLAACRVQTPVGSVQDYRGTTVSAVVTLDGRGDTAMSYNAKTTAATAGVVLAATSTTGSEGGADGAYPPTKLEPDGTWSEGGDDASRELTVHEKLLSVIECSG